MVKLSNNAVSRDSRCSSGEDWIKSFCVDPEAFWYRTAEFTLRGVDTRQFLPKTKQYHDYRGLYFIGEVVDVNGQQVGYNLQLVRSSGAAAGSVI